MFYHEHMFGVKSDSHRTMAHESPVRLGATAAYTALIVAFVIAWFAEVDIPEYTWQEDVFFVALVLCHPITGFLVKRWWALLLPYLAVPLAMPFAEPDPELFGMTDAGVMLLGAFSAMILVAFGIAVRLTVDTFREPR
jgi:hypothetical protein